MGDQEQRQRVAQLKQELEKERSARKQLHHDKVGSAGSVTGVSRYDG